MRTDVAPPFPEGLLGAARGRVSIEFTDDNGNRALLGSKPSGGGEVLWRENSLTLGGVFVVPPQVAASATDPQFERQAQSPAR